MQEKGVLAWGAMQSWGFLNERGDSRYLNTESQGAQWSSVRLGPCWEAWYPTGVLRVYQLKGRCTLLAEMAKITRDNSALPVGGRSERERKSQTKIIVGLG